MKLTWTKNGITILTGDCRQTLKTLPDNSVHCCVTSPPYYGLRDYGHDGQIGLEDTPEKYVAEMVAVFREVRRVLRDDGTLWLNLGDSYAQSEIRNRNGETDEFYRPCRDAVAQTGRKVRHGLKPKDLIGIPWRVAFALQADGWWLRQDIIWHKPNPMPESVTDRCTKSHEYIFLLTKSERYFFDNQAIQEKSQTNDPRPINGSPGVCGRPNAAKRGSGNKERKPASARGVPVDNNGSTNGAVAGSVPWEASETRNRRSVWTVSTKPYGGAHFAVFPPDLIEPCILAGTSEHGCCPDCGTPWRRVVEKDRIKDTRRHTGRAAVGCNDRTDSDAPRMITTTTTIGWEPGCECGNPSQVPCTVLDPFNGSGTTGEVARKCGCLYIGCELNPEYVTLTKQRLQQGNLFV